MSTTISSVAAGGILLSAPDFATWKNALAGDALLSDRIRGLTMTPSRFGNGLPCAYTMGWFLDRLPRSEEHTSELQSLMRNSYAVFCLKKKKNTEIGKDTTFDLIALVFELTPEHIVPQLMAHNLVG